MKKTKAFACLTMMFLLAMAGMCAELQASVAYPGDPPGKAFAETSETYGMLKNNLLEVRYYGNAAGVSMVLRGLQPPTEAICIPVPLTLTLSDGRILKAGDFTAKDSIKQMPLAARQEARRLSQRCEGWQLQLSLCAEQDSVEVLFTATLRDDSNYIIHQTTIVSPQHDLPVDTITLLEIHVEQARLMGDTQGAPVMAGPLFFAFENPMSENSAEEGRLICAMRRGDVLKAGTAVTASCVLGITPPDQRRRGFLYYVERERAHPYRSFLHYNSWYDISWADRKFNEAQALEAIRIFGEELTAKRGVVLQSFVFDDGWDDNRTLWQFHDGFPNGFLPLREEAARYGSAIGAWFSPFGGYGPAREQRLAYGRDQGFEINDSGFSLAGPRYYARYKAICEEMMNKHGVNFFKFDGMGAGLGAGVQGEQKYLADIEALMRLADELRNIAPELYISATTGTWPSPYFLWHADNIWRGAGDMGFSGQGSKRQQWINYRDTWTYRNIVQKGPLYPLNALMTQGIVQAHHGMSAELGDALPEMADEIWSFFGSGVGLQELYIAPALLDAAQWDVLALAARWARANADVFSDTHWVGGDPGENSIYGWACWTPNKALLTLRNPGDQPSSITLNLGDVLELPDTAVRRFHVSTPRPDQREVPAPMFLSNEPCIFELNPFEVLVFDLVPEN